MTKKDYELIAKVLDSSAQSHATNPFTGECMYVGLVEDFAKALQDTNPRFNRAKFLTACGVN
jgi:hypothetical protein